MPQPTDREIEVFNAALELPAGERLAYVDQVCGGDAELRQQVEELLQAEERAGGFLQSAAGAPAALAGGIRPLATPGPKPGDRIGRYKLLEQIGEGGCGVVFMAEQEEPVHRRVALKVIKLGMDTKSVIARFEAERQALALMDHPNIAKVLDAGATEMGRPYFVMELVRGVKITEYCDQNNLSTRERLEMFIQVCQAIQHAHQKGIIHRDIKPSNLLVTVNDGVAVPKVIDFGIAKATQGKLTDQTVFTAFEQFIGTPAYMSPEQAAMTSVDVDTRSDTYSLGVLLYELLTGRTPFDAQELLASGIETMRQTIREREPARPSTRLSTLAQEELTATARRRQLEPLKLIQVVRGDLDWMVMKCLEKDRSRRYETANGLAMDVERHLADEPVVARPPSNWCRFQKFVRRNKLAFAAGAAISIVLLLGVAVSTSEALRALRAERRQSVLLKDAQQARENEAGLRQTAQAEASRAEAAARQLKLTLSNSDFQHGAHLLAEGQGSSALAYLVRSLSENPTNDAALALLTTWLTYHSWAVPTLVLDQGERVVWAEFSPDGKRIVTASWANAAQVWDGQSGRPLTVPLKHEAPVSSAHFSPDGKKIVTASWDNTARVWDAETGQPLTEPMKHGDHVVSVEFSPDGKRIVTASWDKTTRVWDAQTGQPLTAEMRHDNLLNSAQFSPDGKRVVTASEGKMAQVWDAQTGQPLGDPMTHAAAVKSACFSPDGRLIVTASEDKTARLWDGYTGQPLAVPMTHEADVVAAQFSPDGKRILTGSKDKTARLWDAQTGHPLAAPMSHGREVRTIQFSPDGSRIVTTSFDRTARLWDGRTGQPLTEPLKHRVTPFAAQFSPDGKRVITIAEDSPATIWEVQSGQALAEPMKHDASLSSAQFSPDGKRILTASEDMTARVWDAQTAQLLAGPMKHTSNVLSARFSPDGKQLVTVSGRTAYLWDAQTGKLLVGPMTHNDRVVSAQFSPDGKQIATASWDSTARLWDARTGRPLIELVHPNRVSSAQFSPDGKTIVTSWGVTRPGFGTHAAVDCCLRWHMATRCNQRSSVSMASRSSQRHTMGQRACGMRLPASSSRVPLNTVRFP
jgi:WD40 repeat protein/serine/threonine protein kinase